MDDQSAKTVKALYERHSAAFAKLRPTNLFEQAWLDRFISNIKPKGHILDIGCGNATPIAEYLISQGFNLTGVDSSPSMIARCKEKFPEQSWFVADMRELNLGRKFDGMIAWDSFFHLPRVDQRQMFSVFAAHAQERAALLFNSGPDDGEAIGQFEGEPLYHASLAVDEYQLIMRNSGFGVIQHSVEDPHCGGRTVWLAVKHR